MTTYCAIAWWVKKKLSLEGCHLINDCEIIFFEFLLNNTKLLLYLFFVNLIAFRAIRIIVIFDPRPSTKPKHKLEKGFIISVDGVRPSVHTYVCNVRTYKTKQTDQRVKPLFKLVLRLVLGRGSL